MIYGRKERSAVRIRESRDFGKVSASIKTFRHVRARVNRLSEDGWRAAWVTHLAPDMARIRLQDFVLLGPRERVSVVCHGDGSAVRFAGEVSAQAGQEFALSILGALSFEPSAESVRFAVEGIEGVVGDEAGEAEFIALDASAQSVGGLAGRAFAPGQAVGVSLRTPCGPFEAEASVANCGRDASGTGHFRLGLRIVRVSRLDAALWNRMLRERAEEG